MSNLVYETKSSDGKVRRYFHSGDYVVPLAVSSDEAGRIYQFYGGAKLGRDFDTALEVDDESLFRTERRIFVRVGTLANVDLESVARTDVSLGDYLVIRELDEHGNIPKKSEVNVLRGKVSQITQLPGLRVLAS